MSDGNSNAEAELRDIRNAIDDVDHRLVQVMAARAELVSRAAVIKSVLEDDATRRRRQEIVARAMELARNGAAPPAVVEAVFEAMLAAFASHMRDVRAAAQASGERGAPSSR